MGHDGFGANQALNGAVDFTAYDGIFKPYQRHDCNYPECERQMYAKLVSFNLSVWYLFLTCVKIYTNFKASQ